MFFDVFVLYIFFFSYQQIWKKHYSKSSFLRLESTFRGLEEADAGLDLGPVQVLLLGGVFDHQLVELHRDDVMVIWKIIYTFKL